MPLSHQAANWLKPEMFSSEKVIIKQQATHILLTFPIFSDLYLDTSMQNSLSPEPGQQISAMPVSEDKMNRCHCLELGCTVCLNLVMFLCGDASPV